MWIIGVFGIATKYAETFISVKYRVRDHAGDMLGGAMYALERGFPGKAWAKVVAFLFALFATLASFGIGGIAQSNSVIGIIQHYFDPSGTNITMSVILGLILVAAVGMVIIGGIRGIARVCEKVVPFMAIFYVVGCLVIIIMNGAYFFDAVRWIVTCAFPPQAMVGGGAGFAVATALRFGAARGLFSNESGMGSAPLAAANATTRNPARQSLVSMTGTFWDTVIICLMTGLVLTTSIIKHPAIDGLSGNGSELTSKAFSMIPYIGLPILIVGLITFAFSTILGWYYYGERCAVYLFGEKIILPYKILWVIGVFVGSMVELNLIWDLADLMNGLMAIPNIIAVLLLSGVIAAETKKYSGAHINDKDETEIPTLKNSKSGVLG